MSNTVWIIPVKLNVNKVNKIIAFKCMQFYIVQHSKYTHIIIVQFNYFIGLDQTLFVVEGRGAYI